MNTIWHLLISMVLEICVETFDAEESLNHFIATYANRHSKPSRGIEIEKSHTATGIIVQNDERPHVLPGLGDRASLSTKCKESRYPNPNPTRAEIIPRRTAC